MSECHKTETDSQSQRTNQWLPVERGGSKEGQDRVGGLTGTDYYALNRQLQGHTVQHREYSQYFITLNGI